MTVRCDVIWLRRDLRLIDNDLFAGRARAESQLCVYVLEPSWMDDPARRLAPAQWALLWESLMALRGNLLTRGSDLLVCVGEPERLLPPLMHRLGAECLCVHDLEGGNEQESLARVAAAIGGDRVERLPETPLFALPPIPAGAVTPSFPAFLERLSALDPLAPITVALPITLPPWPENGPRGLPSMESLSLPILSAFSPATLRDGEDGVQRLLNQLARGDITLTLAHVGELQLALAIGSVSARQLYALCQSNGAAGQSKPWRWLRHELLWQEYLRWQRESGRHERLGAPALIDPTGRGERRYRGMEAAFESPPRPPRYEAPGDDITEPVAPSASVTGSWFDRY
ncbi:deoxyribodipyrimidine photo-lyase [Salinicola halophilus]|uniref:deoxyribodipyrimidine photo-lyase n=1 Tax=Salinicola halophilus TaxID=184065 RepID=UPI000DA2585F|nr:deoxyribodipyrimidine photo-lyase [Salinicola halophilus]